LVFAQECETELTFEAYNRYRQDIPALQNWLLQKSDSVYCEGVVPVYIHLVLQDEGGNSSGILNLEANAYEYADSVLAVLTRYLGEPIGLTFVRFGEINIIHNTLLADEHQYPYAYLPDFSYTSNALNLYVQGKTKGFGVQPTALDPNNLVFIRYTYYRYPDVNYLVPHEVGHSMGLLHTFSAPQAFSWDVLIDSSWIDHPYTGTYPRELAIRDTVMGLNFPYPNCSYAGDMVCDTDPDWHDSDELCYNRWPDSLTNYLPVGDLGRHCGGYDGTYEDYNEQPINPDPANIMGYNTYVADTLLLTPGQYARMCFYWETVRSLQYDTSFQVNLSEHVDFYGDTLALPVLTTMRFRHQADSVRYCNATTNPDGNFQAVLFDSILTVDVLSLGHADSLHYSYDDWRWGISTLDLVSLKKHILQIDTLSPYSRLSADVNGSGTVTTFDMVIIQQLILGIITEFPDLEDPWQYIPEYIPYEYSDQFYQDPFNMTIDGIAYYNEAPYVQHPDWEYVISDGFNGHSGFDGIKMGNVNQSYEMLTDTDTCNQKASLALPSVLLQSGKEYEFVFYVDAQEALVAFQMGLHLSSSALEYVSAKKGQATSFTVEGNMGLTHISDDALRVAWFQSNAVGESFSNGKELFTLYLKPQTALSNLDSVLYLASNVLPSYFYTEDGCTEALTVQVQINEAVTPHNEGESISNEVEKGSKQRLLLYPNPVEEELRVLTQWAVEEEVEVIVSDIHGKTVWSETRMLPVKASEFVISSTSAWPSGLYLVTLRGARGGQVTEKMLRK